MAELFSVFPYLTSERLIIRKMVDSDIDCLMEITNNQNVYAYIPPFLYRKSRGTLLAAIRNLGGREFDKKRMIVAGIYLRSDPDRLIGLAEIFDHKKRTNQVTLGYRLNESFWHRGIATEAVGLLVDYLCRRAGIAAIKAFVMPENTCSQRVLLRNGFLQEEDTVEGKNWGGKETCRLCVFTCLANHSGGPLAAQR